MKKNLVLILVVCLVALLAACNSGSNTPAPAAQPSNAPPPGDTSSGTAPDDELAQALAGMKQTELNFAVSFNSAHSFIPPFQHWCDRLAEESGGKITATLYPDESLLKNNDLYEGLVSGVCDVVELDPSNAAAYFPMLSAYYVAFMDYGQPEVAWHIANDLINKEIYYQPELDTSQFLFAFRMSGVPGIGLAKKKIETLEDFHGMQIRATGMGLNMMTALGATPVGIPMAEVYEALTKGTVDGATMSIEALHSWNFAEILSYYLDFPFITTNLHIVCINNDVWNSFPAPVQDMITGISQEVSPTMLDTAEEFDQVGYDDGIANGMEVYKLSDEELQRCAEALSSMQSDWIAARTSEGHTDAAEYLDHVYSLAAKYGVTKYSVN